MKLSKAEIAAQNKAYYAAHRAELVAQKRAYRDANLRKGGRLL